MYMQVPDEALSLPQSTGYIPHNFFPVCAQIDTAQTPIKWSRPAFNLPVFWPRAPEMEEKAVPGSRHSVFSFRKIPLLFFSYYPWALCLCYDRASGQRFWYFWSCFYFLISPAHAWICVACKPWTMLFWCKSREKDWDLVSFWFIILPIFEETWVGYHAPSIPPPLCDLPEKKSVIYSES